VSVSAGVRHAEAGLVARVDRWLFAAEPANRMHGAITILAGVIGLRIGLGPYRELAGQPAVLFDPPFFLTWLREMPSAQAIAVVQAGGVAAATMAVLGRSRRAAFALAWIALLVLAGLRASRGKIQHNDLLLLLAAVPFLAAPTDTSWRDGRADVRYGWPIRTGMVVAAVAYFFCGAAKVLTAGWRWALSDNMQNVLYDGARSPKTHAPELARWIADHGGAARAVAVITLVVELGFPLALVFVRLRPIAVASVVVLHGGIFVLLGLDYSAWVGTVAALFVDWPRYWMVIARSGQFSAPMRA
jgi:hypothetical protein